MKPLPRKLLPRWEVDTVLRKLKELELYKPELVEKPCLLLINKMDKPNAEKNFEKLKEQIKNIKDIAESMPEEMQPERYVTFDSIVSCSTKKDKESIDFVKNKIRTMLDIYSDTLCNEKELQQVHSKIKSQLYDRNIQLL